MRPRRSPRTDRALLVPAALVSTVLIGLLLAPDAAAVPDAAPVTPPEAEPPAQDQDAADAPDHAHSLVPTIGLVLSLLTSFGAVLWIRRL